MRLDVLASQEYAHVFADTISLVDAVILCVAVINGNLL